MDFVPRRRHPRPSPQWPMSLVVCALAHPKCLRTWAMVSSESMGTRSLPPTSSGLHHTNNTHIHMESTINSRNCRDSNRCQSAALGSAQISFGEVTFCVWAHHADHQRTSEIRTRLKPQLHHPAACTQAHRIWSKPAQRELIWSKPSESWSKPVDTCTSLVGTSTNLAEANTNPKVAETSPEPVEAKQI